ncbi:MAG: hypothetical protein Q9201_006174 [Fulgogasparrea decipioides]
MQARCSLLLILLQTISVRAAEAIATAGPVIARPSAAPNPNLSTLPNIPDADFDYISRYDNTPLSENACVMVFMAAMRQLALSRFEDLLPDGLSWQHERYPGVVLLLEPPQGSRTISVRFALWTVNAALRDMMFRDRFKKMELLATYRGVRIGTVQMFPPSTSTPAVNAKRGPAIMQHPQGDGLAPTTSSRNSVAFDVNSTRVGADGGTVTDDQLQAHVDFLAKVIDRRDIWVMTAWSMLYLAPSNPYPLGFWRTTIPSVASEVTSIWNSVRPRPGTRPYLVTNGDLISLLARLPEYLLQENKFREMNIAINENGIDLAKGSFRTKPLSVQSRWL